MVVRVTLLAKQKPQKSYMCLSTWNVWRLSTSDMSDMLNNPKKGKSKFAQHWRSKLA